MEAETDRTPTHPPGRPLGCAVVCIPEDGPRSQIAGVLEDTGFEVLAEVDRGIDCLPAVAEFTPDVVVLDVALLGTLGLRLLEVIKTLEPQVAIVALVPLQDFGVAVVEAGAHAVPVDDLRPLRELLSQLAVHPPSQVGTRRTKAPPS